MAIIGSLEDLSIAEILQILALGKKTGVLSITSENEAGQVFLDQGRALHAVSDDTRGEDAIFRIMEFESGYFEFEACEVECDITINSNVESMILEAMRRADESGSSRQGVENILPKETSKSQKITETTGSLRKFFGDYYLVGVRGQGPGVRE